LDELAEKVLGLNWGLWRFISALNRVINDPKNAHLKETWGEEVDSIVKAFKDRPHYL
jgi:flagellar hook-associated protein FlgK